MIIGYIGFGEAASCMAEGLLGEGVKSQIAYDVLADKEEKGLLVRTRAANLQVALCQSEAEVVSKADIIFAAVPSAYAVDACKKICKTLKAGQIYVDVSASTPKAKQEIWALLQHSGVLFADAAMLGALGELRHKVPILACGNGAEAFAQLMTPYGMSITCMDGAVGAASAVKLMRSVYTKGIATVMIEMLQAANVYGVSELVVASLAKSLDGVPFERLVQRYVKGAVIHAGRRANELNGSLKMLEEASVDAPVTMAAAGTYAKIFESGKFENVSLETEIGLNEILDLLHSI